MQGDGYPPRHHAFNRVYADRWILEIEEPKLLNRKPDSAVAISGSRRE